MRVAIAISLITRARIAGDLRNRRAHGAKALNRAGIFTVAQLWNAVPAPLDVGRHQWRVVSSDAAWRRYPAPLLPLLQKHRPSACAGAGTAYASRARNFAQHLLTKAAERLRRGDYYCGRLGLGLHLFWVADLGGWWDETMRSAFRKRARPAIRWAVSISSGCACPVINRCRSGSCC